jgi:excisionase family DNA binding protein
MRKKQTQTAAPVVDGFLDESQLLPRLGVSRRTLKNWRDKGQIPFIRLSGSRRVLFCWENVKAALLRQQKGQS